MGYGEESTKQRRTPRPPEPPRALPGPSSHRSSPPARGCSACPRVSPLVPSCPRLSPAPGRGRQPRVPRVPLKGPIPLEPRTGRPSGQQSLQCTFFAPIFILQVGKPWEELGNGDHVQRGRQNGVPGDCRVQRGEGLLNKTLLELTCGFFYSVQGNAELGKSSLGHVQ